MICHSNGVRMNKVVQDKLKQGIAIALKQFPFLKFWDKKSGIYLWERTNEDEVYCWYIGKAKNLLRRTAQHIVDNQSHLDKSITKHGYYNIENFYGWSMRVLQECSEDQLDEYERMWIKIWQQQRPNSKTYNIESGGTTGKTIIGERKQRRDVKWKAEAKKKVLMDYREYFDLQPKENAYKKNTQELKAEPKKLYDEFYD